jgi:putative peptidoglycan lipid II flippase
MIANMVLNLGFVGALFALWHRPDDLGDGWLAAIARVPGLHMGLGLASALASYLNLAQLWLALRRQGVYVAQPGWPTHVARLAAACVAMVAVLAVGLHAWSDFSAWPTLERAWKLGVLVAAGAAAFAATLFACGFRLRELRAS